MWRNYWKKTIPYLSYILEPLLCVWAKENRVCLWQNHVHSRLAYTFTCAQLVFLVCFWGHKQFSCRGNCAISRCLRLSTGTLSFFDLSTVCIAVLANEENGYCDLQLFDSLWSAIFCRGFLCKNFEFAQVWNSCVYLCMCGLLAWVNPRTLLLLLFSDNRCICWVVFRVWGVSIEWCRKRESTCSCHTNRAFAYSDHTSRLCCLLLPLSSPLRVCDASVDNVLDPKRHHQLSLVFSGLSPFQNTFSHVHAHTHRQTTSYRTQYMRWAQCAHFGWYRFLGAWNKEKYHV